MNTLEQWQNNFQRLDESVWPGPRPMRDLDRYAGSLVARDSDSERVADMVMNNPVVILSGTSGVGKSSMLNVGLKPTLDEEYGCHLFVCDNWDTQDKDQNAEAYVLHRIRDQLPSTIREGLDAGDDDPGLVSLLHDRYGDRAVIILDQFEELIRYNAELFHTFMTWIEDSIFTYHVRFLLSLRSEYVYRLNDLDLGPFTYTHRQLAPIADRGSIEQIIRTGRANSTHQRRQGIITDAACDRLIELWDQSGAQNAWSEIGLLHLQAVLYVLDHQTGADPVENDDVDRLCAGLNAEKFFHYGLSESVTVTLDHCQRACEPTETWAGIDEVLVTRARELIVEMTMHLSSGGYKLNQERGPLAERVLREVLNQCGIDGLATMEDENPIAYHAIHALTKLVDHPSPVGRVLEKSADKEGATGDWLTVLFKDLAGDWRDYTDMESTDPGAVSAEADTVSAGVMMGMRREAILTEEFRNFYFALEWLRTSELVRITSPEPGQSMVSLVHDRYADGLEKWRGQLEIGPMGAIVRTSAIRGRQLTWTTGHDSFTGTSATEPRYLINLRWVAGQIDDTIFRYVVFSNCDFRGSSFRRCHFEGVVFLNCLLDEVKIEGCTVDGRPNPVTDRPSQNRVDKELPAFYIPMAPSVAQAMHRTRGTDPNARQLYSRTSGLPALPDTDGTKPTFPWSPQPGGLVVSGGRLSSLIVRRCSFDNGGQLSLRFIAGSSLEVSEQGALDLDIESAAIRGLTITKRVDDALNSDKESQERASREPQHARTQADVAPYSVAIHDAQIINAWFGLGLHGTAVIKNCKLWQCFNASRDFTVKVTDCAYGGLVNCDEPDTPPDQGLDERGLSEARWSDVAKLTRRTDFRSDPASGVVSADG